MPKNGKPFDVFDFGDGAYAYFAVVTKNYDYNENNKGKPAHFNEVQVQAIPYSMDYTGKSNGDSDKFHNKLDPDQGKVWLPYLCDMVGYDTRIEGDDAKKDTQGYGFHSLPEVGSVVVVLALESGFSGYAQHIVLGNFWNDQLLTPQIDDFKYKKGHEEEYELKKKADDLQARADLNYYRTKQGTTFIHDDAKKVMGFYKCAPAKEEDAKKREKLLSYFMFDEEGGNLDIKVNSFSVRANNISILVKKGLLIDNKVKDKGVFNFTSADEPLNVFAKNDKVKLEVKGDNGEIGLSGKKVNLNKGKEITPPEPQEPRRLKITDGSDPNNENKKPDFSQVAIRKIIEVNIVRKNGEFVGPDHTVRLDKGTQVFSGTKIPDTMTKEGELNIDLSPEDLENALGPFQDKTESDLRFFNLDVKENKLEKPKGTNVFTEFKVLDSISDTIAEDPSLENPPLSDKLLFLNSKVSVKLDLSKAKNNGNEVIDVVRKVVFVYNDPDVGKKIKIKVHYMDFDGEADTAMSLCVGINPVNPIDPEYCMIKPEYSKEFELEATTTMTWAQIVADGKSEDENGAHEGNYKALLDFIASNTSKDFYVDMFETLDRNDLVAKTPKECEYLEKPGVIKFTVSPVSINSISSSASKPEEVCVARESPVLEPAEDVNVKGYANFSYSKNSSNKLEDIDTAVGANDTLIDRSQPDIPEEIDVYVRYRVVRSLPLFLFCRALNDNIDNQSTGDAKRDANIKKVLSGGFPVFEKDIYGADSAFDHNKVDEKSARGNLLWKFVPCSFKLDKYVNLLNFPEGAEKHMIFVEDSPEGKSTIGKLLKYETDNYRNNADNDKIVQYKFDRKTWGGVDKGGGKMTFDGIGIARYGSLKDGDNFVNDDFRLLRGFMRGIFKAENEGARPRYFFGSPSTPVLSYWTRIDNMEALRDKPCGNDVKSFIEPLLDYTFAYLSGYIGGGTAGIYRTASLERRVHGDLSSSKSLKAEDRNPKGNRNPKWE